MQPANTAFLFVASAAAGAVNSVAGGGTLLSFPAAIAAGLPPVVANATNAVALMPGSLAAVWAFRTDLAGAIGRRAALLALPTAVGAALGAAILRWTPQHLFDLVIPWLVFGATVAILLQEAIVAATRRRLQTRSATAPAKAQAAAAASASASALAPAPATWRLGLVLFGQLLVGVYGGYFGAAMGIIMLAFLGFIGGTGPRAVHETNATKNALAVVINLVASAEFVIYGLIDYPTAAVMAVGAGVGGIVGARLARRASARAVRRCVVAIGFTMTALLAYRAYRVWL